MSHTPLGGHPQGWDHKLADRSSLPPAPGEEKSKRHVFTHPHLPKGSGGWREETEGSSGSSARSLAATPPYIRWARALPRLLEDAEGVRLFRKYVCCAGGVHVDRLNFYFAVQGLRHETEPSKVRQVVCAIYKFLRKSQLAMPEDLRAQVKQCIKDGGPIEKTIFDDMEQEVTRAITETTYQSFLRSEAYVSYVSAASQPLCSADCSPAPREPPPGALSPAAALATLHEGQELAAPPARLTHGALLATQSRRLQDHAPNRKRSVYNAHVSYAGYCPASRQDSSRSASSVCTDSDCLSDGMSMRGARERDSSRQHSRSQRYGVINTDTDANLMIPRTQRIQSEQLRVLPPSEFAPLLIEKLERVKREQESKERLERRLADGDGEDAAMQSLPPQLVAAAIRDKLQVDDDNDQDILDQHVSRVWSERTPRASPPPAARRAVSALSSDSGLCLAPLSHRSLSKRTVTELTDSGVSVASEAEGRVLLWVGGVERRSRPRNQGSKSSSTSGAEHTVVVMSFLEESVPYRFKVPASPLTLRTLKDYLPKRGNYRYFFKTECADLDNTVIQEEVSSDNDILPMFEGKVMARVKSIE